MCVLSIKVPIRKKSGNLFNDPRTYKLAVKKIQSPNAVFSWPLYTRIKDLSICSLPSCI